MKNIALLLCGILFVFTAPAHASRGKIINGVLTALGIGAAAASDEKVKQITARFEEKKRELKDAGYSPQIGAQYEISINLDTSADDIFWADFIGRPDIGFTVEGIGPSEVLIPRVHEGYKGGALQHVIYGAQAPSEGTVAIHIFDDDEGLNKLFRELKPTEIEVGIPVYSVPVGIKVTLPRGKEKLISSDNIGSIVVRAPKNESRWKAEGNVVDRNDRKIGTFSISQIPILTGKEETAKIFLKFLKWALIAGGVLLAANWVKGLFAKPKAQN